MTFSQSSWKISLVDPRKLELISQGMNDRMEDLSFPFFSCLMPFYAISNCWCISRAIQFLIV